MQQSIVIAYLSLLLLTGCVQQPTKPSSLSDQTIAHPHSNVSTRNQEIQSAITQTFDQMAQIGRYSVVSATPTVAQENILTVMITVTMPKPIQTVGDAIHHLLKPSGYRLARFDAQGPEVIQLLNLPLPDVHRKLGPMPLQEALLTLASPAFRLYTDPVHRLIAYDLKPDYQLELAP